MNIETAKKVKDLITEQIELKQSVKYLNMIYQQNPTKLTGLYLSFKDEAKIETFKELPLHKCAMNILLKSTTEAINNRIEEIDNQIKQIEC